MYVLAYDTIAPTRNHYSSAQHVGLIAFVYYQGETSKKVKFT